MKEYIALKIRIKPTKEQQVIINKTFGCVRSVYNKLLEVEKTTGKVESYTICFDIEKPWLKEVDTSSYANAVVNLKSAITNHKKNPSHYGEPQYKSKHAKVQSYTTSVTNNNSRIIDKKHIRIPKVGVIKAKIHRDIKEEYKLKKVTIEKDVDGKYYAVLLFLLPLISVENQTDKEITKVLSIDFSLEHLGVLSNGEVLDYPKFYRSKLNKLKELSRRLSLCTPKSNNWYKRKNDIARVYVEIKNARNDYLNKLAKRLADNNDIVAIETLDLQEMSKHNHFGKSIYDDSYGTFIRKLDYKLRKQGKKLIKVDKYYPSSKKCSICGKVKEKLELSERTYTCECGSVMDRDYNAAINIGIEGMRILFEEEQNKKLAMIAN